MQVVIHSFSVFGLLILSFDYGLSVLNYPRSLVFLLFYGIQPLHIYIPMLKVNFRFSIVNFCISIKVIYKRYEKWVQPFICRDIHMFKPQFTCMHFHMQGKKNVTRTSKTAREELLGRTI